MDQIINPGELFIERFGLPESIDDINRYANFLREEAGLSSEPPIDLSRVYTRFAIQTPKRRPLPKDIQGLLLSPDMGIIVINDNDPLTRQRFSEAHELIEFLFSALPTGEGWAARQTGIFKHNPKERLCQAGAAELLMPSISLLARIRIRGVSFQTARQLALEYQVSVTAALVQMTRIGPGRHAVVLWRMKNKPTEIQDKTSEAQISFLSNPTWGMPPKKLRVEWAMSHNSYIPPDKSVPGDSSIYAAWQQRNFTMGKDRLELGRIQGIFRCENQPVEVEDEYFVLSLLHLPGDDCGATYNL